MLLVLTCVLATAAAAPYYDLRQDGDENVQVDVKNLAIIVVLPKRILPISEELAGFIIRNVFGRHRDKQTEQDEDDAQSTDAFLLNSDSEGDKFEEADEDKAETHKDYEGFKVIGSTEQCGPDYKRDPVSFMCRPIAETKPETMPEAVNVEHDI